MKDVHIFKKSILIVDDDESIRKLMKRVLSRAGYDVMTAADGFEGLKMVSENKFNLIILDMNMPQMTGVEFLKKLNESCAASIPVLMLSGTSDTDLIIQSYELGAYDFIRKPEQTEIMLKRVENGLKIGEIIFFNDFIKLELLMAKKLLEYLYPEENVKTDRVELHFWMRPLSDIGGDLFDSIVFRDGRIIFFIADISGHSISGAMYTAIVKMIFRNALKESENPGKILEQMNQELFENLPTESFVTMFCGLIDAASGEFIYANAGHPNPYFQSEGKFSLLEGNDSFLGPIDDAKFRTFSMPVKKGDIIVAFTDGILELKDLQPEAGRKLIEEAFFRNGVPLKERFAKFKESLILNEQLIIDDCSIMAAEIV